MYFDVVSLNAHLCRLVAVLFLFTSHWSAAERILFESGDATNVGTTLAALPDEDGKNIGGAFSHGVRFHVAAPAAVTAIGANLVGIGSYYAAIVELDGPDDLPDSIDLSTPDLIAQSTQLLPEVVTDVRAPINARLEPGWYFVTIGDGLFDANGSGVLVAASQESRAGEFFSARVGSGIATWVSTDNLPPSRLVVSGTLLPEPTTVQIATLAVACAYVSSRPSRSERQVDSVEGR